MDENSVHSVRENSRESLRLNRRFHREEVNDVQRCIKDLRISPQNFEEVVQKLKSKTLVTVADLQTLKNGLVEDQKNIEMVLSCHGTLRGLVRELSGNDVKKQCAAASCCCNLALGDSRACVAVAKAAGPYLTAALDNLTTELAVNCAWALGNLAGSGPKACDVLVAQGALAKLCDILDKNNDDIQEAAMYALVHFAYSMEDDFKSEYMQKIVSALSKREVTPTSCQLVFILSCHGDFIECMPEEFLQNTLASLTASVSNHNMCKDNCDCELVYVVRTLANMDKEIYSEILNYFFNNGVGKRLWQIINTDTSGPKESLLWMFGNLYNYCSDHEFFTHA